MPNKITAPDRSVKRRRARQLREVEQGTRQLARPTVGGWVTMIPTPCSDEGQPGESFDETISDGNTANIVVGNTDWVGAVMVLYWMKSGSDAAGGIALVWQTGGGGVGGARVSEMIDDSDSALDVTIAGSVSFNNMRLDVTNNTGSDLTFTGQYFYCGV